jgi:hypothetical protein
MLAPRLERARGSQQRTTPAGEGGGTSSPDRPCRAPAPNPPSLTQRRAARGDPKCGRRPGRERSDDMEATETQEVAAPQVRHSAPARAGLVRQSPRAGCGLGQRLPRDDPTACSRLGMTQGGASASVKRARHSRPCDPDRKQQRSCRGRFVLWGWTPPTARSIARAAPPSSRDNSGSAGALDVPPERRRDVRGRQAAGEGSRGHAIRLALPVLQLQPRRILGHGRRDGRRRRDQGVLRLPRAGRRPRVGGL